MDRGKEMQFMMERCIHDVIMTQTCWYHADLLHGEACATVGLETEALAKYLQEVFRANSPKLRNLATYTDYTQTL